MIEPGPRHGFEVVFHAHQRRGFRVPLALHRVRPPLAARGIFPLSPRLGQRDGRIGADREPLFLAHKTVLPAPVFAAGGQHFKVQAAGCRRSAREPCRADISPFLQAVSVSAIWGTFWRAVGVSPTFFPRIVPRSPWLSTVNDGSSLTKKPRLAGLWRLRLVVCGHQLSDSWRRGSDSNRRYVENVHRISSPAHSTTLPPLQVRFAWCEAAKF